LEQFPKFSKVENFNIGARKVVGNDSEFINNLEGTISFILYLSPDTVTAVKPPAGTPGRSPAEEDL